MHEKTAKLFQLLNQNVRTNFNNRLWPQGLRVGEKIIFSSPFIHFQNIAYSTKNLITGTLQNLAQC